MTVAESIARASSSLPPDKQQEVLDFVEFLAQRRPNNSGGAASLDSVKQALAASAGIWKDRTDLPDDSAQAAQSLRERATNRGTP
jgi:hypothetical protein